MKEPPQPTPLTQGLPPCFRPFAGHRKEPGSKRRGVRAIGTAIAGPDRQGDFPDSTFDLALRLKFVSKETQRLCSLLRGALYRGVNRRHQVDYVDRLEQV